MTHAILGLAPAAAVSRRALKALAMSLSLLLSCERDEVPSGRARDAATSAADAAKAEAPAIEPAAPQPQPSEEATKKPDFAALLGLEDPAIAEKVEMLLQAAARSLDGQPLPDPDGVYRFLLDSIEERGDQVTFKRSPEELSRGAGAILEARERWGTEAEAMLRAAADEVQRAKWGYSSFVAKSEVLRALRTAHASPAVNAFRFHSDVGLARGTRPLPCPSEDPRWTLAKKGRYFEDKTFLALVAIPDARLPDGAIREAVSLLGIPVVMNEFIQGGSGEIPVLADTVVLRYGERALGCLFEALADPLSSVAASGGSVASLRYNAQKIAAKLPTESSVKLFRAALLAGWTDWSRDLPSSPEHQALAKELGEGPFLPAFSSPYRLPTSPAGG